MLGLIQTCLPDLPVPLQKQNKVSTFDQGFC